MLSPCGQAGREEAEGMLLIPPAQERCGSLVGLWRGCFPSSSTLGMRKSRTERAPPRAGSLQRAPGSRPSPCSQTEPLVPLLSIYYYYYVQVVLHQETPSPRVSPCSSNLSPACASERPGVPGAKRGQQRDRKCSSTPLPPQSLAPALAQPCQDSPHGPGHSSPSSSWWWWLEAGGSSSSCWWWG